MNWLDPGQARTAACFVTCCGVLIASLEWLTPTAKLGMSGLLSSGWTGTSRLVGLWRAHGLRAVVALRAGFALAYLLSVLLSHEEGVLALAAGLLCLPLRAPNPVGVYAGMNGAEHMMVATLVALGPTFVLNSSLV
jgi:hypothetical protein